METFSALLALYEGNPPVTGEFLSQRSVTWGFDVFFDLLLNKRLSKQSRQRWFETPSRSLWRHCNNTELCVYPSSAGPVYIYRIRTLSPLTILPKISFGCNSFQMQLHYLIECLDLAKYRKIWRDIPNTCRTVTNAFLVLSIDMYKWYIYVH